MKRWFCVLIIPFFSLPSFASEAPWQPLKTLVVKIDLMSGNRKAKGPLIKQAREMADQCVVHHPDEAGCYYYRGQATGLYYEIHVFGYQNGIRSMIKDWEKAIALDPTFDHGGPNRVLGEMYTALPKYFGTKDVRQDLKKAAQHIETSIKIDPDYPTQWLDWVEVLLKEKKISEAKQALETAKALISKWPNDPYFSSWQETAKELEKELKK